MIRPFTCICMLLAAGSGLYLYQVKHQAQMLDRAIDKTLSAVDTARQRSGLLRAEYALLNDPSRLSDLATQLLPGLKTTAPSQFTTLAELDKHLPDIGVPAQPATAPADPDATPPLAEAQPAETPAATVVAEAQPPAALPAAAPPQRPETARAEAARGEPSHAETPRPAIPRAEPVRPAVIAALPSRPVVPPQAVPQPVAAPQIAAVPPVRTAPGGARTVMTATILPPSPPRPVVTASILPPPTSLLPATAEAVREPVQPRPMMTPAVARVVTPRPVRTPSPAAMAPTVMNGQITQIGEVGPRPMVGSALGMARTMAPGSSAYPSPYGLNR